MSGWSIRRLPEFVGKYWAQRIKGDDELSFLAPEMRDFVGPALTKMGKVIQIYACRRRKPSAIGRMLACGVQGG